MRIKPEVLFLILVLSFFLFIKCKALDIVKLVEKKNSLNSDESNNKESIEEAIEVEEAISSGSTKQDIAVEQVFEACNSLINSFKRECSNTKVSEKLLELISSCKDCVGNLQKVKDVSAKLSKEGVNVDLSNLSECEAMIYTTSFFLYTSGDSEEETDEAASLELESLEVESNLMNSSEEIEDLNP